MVDTTDMRRVWDQEERIAALAAKYPGCKLAVKTIEENDGGNFDIAKKSGATPEKHLWILIRSIEFTIKLHGPEVAADMVAILPEMEHPDFLRYVSDRLKGDW